MYRPLNFQTTPQHIDSRALSSVYSSLKVEVIRLYLQDELAEANELRRWFVNNPVHGRPCPPRQRSGWVDGRAPGIPPASSSEVFSAVDWNANWVWYSVLLFFIGSTSNSPKDVCIGNEGKEKYWARVYKHIHGLPISKTLEQAHIIPPSPCILRNSEWMFSKVEL